VAEPLPWCHLNGERLRLAEARISPLDRSFLFGDGIYEVIPVYGGRLFRAPAHLARLARSAAAIRLTNPHDAASWTALLRDLARSMAAVTSTSICSCRVAPNAAQSRALPDIAHRVCLLLTVAGAGRTPATAWPHHRRGRAGRAATSSQWHCSNVLLRQRLWMPAPPRRSCCAAAS
jgi:branched-subunit amino acid aminotransferase/4-amino-4-deoxychorismate lyase